MSAVQSTDRTVSFQGRLTTKAGATVPDGYYNMQFKIYQGGVGTAVGNGGVGQVWTESYANSGGTNGVQVKNGMFVVNLGSQTPFGSAVDWNHDTLWLSMNVAGSITDCYTFGEGSCTGDGEMLPMKRITAAPYAINSGAVGGKEAGDLVQLGQGMQTDPTGASSIAINKTGGGHLLQLQSSGTDVFVMNSTGSISFGAATNQTINIAESAVGTGKSLTISAGDAASGTNAYKGGDLVLQGGAGDGTGDTGDVVVKANGSNSEGTFQVQNAADTTIFNVNTATGTVNTGSITLSSGELATEQSGVGETVSLWENGTVSASSNDDSGSLNLGVNFKSSVPGYVTGIKYYNPSGNNAAGTDIGKLWACNDSGCGNLNAGGVELASVTFASDTTPGWKTATFSEPVLISPNTNYIASYYTAAAMYHASINYFNAPYVNGSLTAPKDESPLERNGVYIENSANFPNGSFQQSNYWVDITFQPLADVDMISSSSDLMINSAGNMTIGPSTNQLTLQGGAVAINGDTTVKSGSAGDTASTFQVQNSAGDSIVSVSATDDKISIGESDTTGTLLVLDTKTSAGDPTGTSGAMYYNSDASKFRCYQAGAWADCITPLPVSKVASTDTSNSTTSPVDVSDLSFQLAANTNYYYKFVIIHEAAAATTGIGFGVTTPTSPTLSNWCVNTTTQVSSTATPGHWGSYCGVGDVVTTTDGSQELGTNFTSTMEGYIQTNATDAGTLQLRMQSELAAQTTVKSGSFGILQIVQ